VVVLTHAATPVQLTAYAFETKIGKASNAISVATQRFSDMMFPRVVYVLTFPCVLL
jgi:hypothetical protein